MSFTPAVGRQVHYVARGSADGVFPKTCRSATVTEVERIDPDAYPADQPNVGLAVLNPDGLFFHPLEKCGGVLHDGGHEAEHDTRLCDGLDHTPGSWHVPARS